MNELHVYLDEQEQVEHESFMITDDSSANWALRKIKEYKDAMEKNNALAQGEIDKIEQWNTEVNTQAQNSIDYFQSLLTQYAMQKREEDPKFKSLKLPNGKFGFRKRQPKFIYDDEKLLEYLKKAEETDLIKVKEVPNKESIKKLFPVVDGKLYNVGTGEVIDGVTVEEQDDSFNVVVD